jgi:hypothetical protein
MKKERIKKFLLFISNPRLILCLLLAWFITNGWSYVMFGIGTYYQIEWMIAVSSGYLAFLWLPFTPEKVVTVAIAIALLRILFPNDTKTLRALKNLHVKVVKRKKERKAKNVTSPKEKQQEN